jgi:hypothetical protein
MARSAKLSRPVAILCEIVVTAGNTGMETIIVSSDEIAMLHATGVPIAIKKIKLKTSIITGNNSMAYSDF